MKLCYEQIGFPEAFEEDSKRTETLFRDADWDFIDSASRLTKG